MMFDRILGWVCLLVLGVQFVLIVLKLTAVLSWSWGWVLSPVLLFGGIIFLAIAVLSLLSYLGVIDVER